MIGDMPWPLFSSGRSRQSTSLGPSGHGAQGRRLGSVALALAVLASTASLSLVSQAQGLPVEEPLRLPSLGEPDHGDLTEGTERRLGDFIMRQVRRDGSYLDDAQLRAHVEAIWAPLYRAGVARGEVVAETERAFAWEVFLIRDKTINAFALPGGYVGVHLGLIAQSVQQDELAAVLAHELTHVTQRHIARSNSQARRQSMLGLAAMLLGVLASARSNSPDMAQATVMGSQAAMVQGQLNFSRDMEREADRIGFSILMDAGYAPEGAALMFERLDRASRLNDNGSFPYLRSHPLTVERIGEARTRAQAAEQRLGAARGSADQTVVVTAPPLGIGPPPAAQHALMRGRARVLMDTSVQALRYWQQVADGGGVPEERGTVLYAAALASAKLGEHGRAEGYLRTLQQQALPASTEPTVIHLAAEIAQAAGRGDRAVALLERLDGGRRAVRLARCEAAVRWVQHSQEPRDRALALQALQRHTDGLQTWVIDHPTDAAAWSLLAISAQLQGEPLRGIRAEAEARWALGDLNGALDRFRAGQRMVRSMIRPDHVEASVIDARLRQLERERRRTFAEMRGVREEDLPPVLPPNLPL